MLLVYAALRDKPAPANSRASKPADLNAGGKTVGDMKSEDKLKTAELLTLLG
jgi:hypothetical protein